MDIRQYDRNFADKQCSDKPNVVWYDIRKAPFRIYGLHDPQAGSVFTRMPRPVAKAVSAGVCALSENTAGGRVRFSTDSPYIALRAAMPGLSQMTHMALTGSSGFDLYLDDAESTVFVSSFRPTADAKTGFAAYIDIAPTDLKHGMNTYTVNFPLYSGVNAVQIGIEKGYHLGAGAEYRPIAPVVYYGSSITQGGCASRPGTCYQGFLSRRYNIDYVNLGFSGNARGERAMAEYIASLHMSMFVCDYDHNSSPEELEKNHYPFYQIIREKHPDLPYLMISKPDIVNFPKEAEKRRQIIRASYERAREAGDEKVYFLDGGQMFRSGTDAADCTVDGCHPNDLGFYRMAQAIAPYIETIFN